MVSYEGHIGLQAGQLWTFGDSNAIYYVKFGGNCSPFSNPKFKECYQNVDRVVIKRFQEKEIVERVGIDLINEIMSAHLTLQEAEQLSALMGRKITEESGLPYIKLLLILVHYLQENVQDIQNPSQIILDQAKTEGKEIESINIDDATWSLLLESVKELMKLKPFFTLFRSFFTSPNFIPNFKQHVQEEGFAWDLGVLKKSEKLKEHILSVREDIEVAFASELTAEQVSEIDRKLEASVNFIKKFVEGGGFELFEVLKNPTRELKTTWDQLKPLLNNLPDELENYRKMVDIQFQLLNFGGEVDIQEMQLSLLHLETYCKQIQRGLEFFRMESLLEEFSNKEGVKDHIELISTLLKKTFSYANQIEKTKTLFLIETELEFRVITKTLQDKKIKLIGPIKEPIKPRGFLWKIEQDNKIVGYFLASIHLATSQVVNAINSETFGAFEECNVLGVEMDISNPESVAKLNGNLSTMEQALLALLDPAVQKVALKDLGLGEADPQTALEVIKEVMDIQAGLDVKFIEKAKSKEMEIVDLDQPELMDRQKAQFMQELPTDPAAKWKAIKKGIEGIRTLSEDFETGVFSFNQEEADATMIERNHFMTNATDKLILQGKKPFSVIGGKHFFGSTGIVSLMQQKGYKVTRLLSDERLV